jgi:hypothetical protein
LKVRSQLYERAMGSDGCKTTPTRTCKVSKTMTGGTKSVFNFMIPHFSDH